MNKKEYGMIAQMKVMQAKLDEAILKEHKCEYSLENTRLALIDELGETNHENKGNWCWWKYTQKPVDREMLLEELADAWHFALSIDNHENNLMPDAIFRKAINDNETFTTSYVMSLIVSRITYILPLMVVLTKKLGFRIEDVYAAYMEKNEENYERLASGY